MTDQQTDWRKWYFHFGLELRVNGNQLVGTCPWCHKDDHYFIGKNNGIGTCQRAATERCTGSSNHYRFLSYLSQEAVEQTTDSQYQKLSDNRGIKVDTLKHHNLGINPINDQWLIPSYNEKESVINLYQCLEVNKNTDPPTIGYDIRSTPFPCSHALYGINDLTNKTETIYLCEGHWDRLVLKECLAYLKQLSSGQIGRLGKPNWDFKKSTLASKVAVLAVPGANVFKDKWCQYFKGRKVIILNDNDPAGMSMLSRIIIKLSEVTSSPKEILHFNWEVTKDLNDVRDMIYAQSN